MKFTGHERDYTCAIDGMHLEYIDCMHARYYDGRAERFLSVHPVMEPGRNMRTPQGGIATYTQ